MPFEPAYEPTDITPPGQILREGGFLESFGGEFSRGIARGFLNVGAGIVGTAEWLIPGQQESLIEAKRRIEASEEDFSQEYGNWAGWAGRVLGEALPYMGSALVGGYAGAGIAGGIAGAGTAGLTGQAAALGAGLGAKGIATGVVLGAAPIAFAVEGQQAYDDAIAGGASENEANAERLIVGTINAAIEAAQITKLMKFHKSGSLSLKSFIRNVRGRSWDLVKGDAKKFSGQVLRTALEEGLEEAAQEGVSISVPGLLRGDIRRKPDGSVDWGYVLDRVGGAFAGGAFAGGVLGGAGALVGAAPEIGRPSDADIDSTIARINDMDIPAEEKALWNKRLEEFRVEQKEEITAEQAEYITQVATQNSVTGEVFTGTIHSESMRKAAEDAGLAFPPAAGKGQEYNLVNGFITNRGRFVNRIEAEEIAKQADQIKGETFLPEEGLHGLQVKAAPGSIVNIYKTVSGSRTGIKEEEVIRKGDRYVDSVTGEDVVLDTELSGSALQKESMALNRDYDEQLVKAVGEMDTSLREEHIAQIKREKGKRISAAKELFKDPDINPRLRFRLVRSQLADELGLRFDPIQMDENRINYYYQRIAIAPELRSFERLQAESGLNAIFGLDKDSKGQAKLPEPNQIKQLEKVFGPKLAKALMDLRGDTRKTSAKVIEALNLPRALLASFDVSAGGRQGLLLLPIAPKQWAKAIGQGYKAWTSPEYAGYIDLQIKTDPYYQKFRDSGGHLSQIGGLTSGEEIFSGRWAKLIPGIRASERAYTTTLNSLRFYTFKKYASKWAGTGKSDDDYKMLAKFINHATGRGDIKGLEEYAPFLNAAFFAPRLQMGRIQSITDLFKGVGQELKAGEFSATRKIIAADLVSFFAGGMGILALLSRMKGVTVEKDPRSSDFGKIRFGNTRIDFWTGYSQIARLVAQLITAERKGADTGRVMAADRGNIIWRFIQTKLSPAAGLSVDLIRGETFLGQQLELTPESVSKQIYERFTPLFIQDVTDAARHQGLLSAGIVAPLAVHGIGAMTYPVRPSTEAARLRETVSKETFGRSWDELGDLTQRYLRQERPEIGLLERKARSERENFDTVARRLEEQRKVMNKIIDKLPVDVQKDIDNLDVNVPGLSRYVANGWYLNDSRYEDYQRQIKAAMSIYLTRLRKTTLWNNAPPEMKAPLMEEVIKAIKKEVRDKLLKDTTIKDVQKIKGL